MFEVSENNIVGILLIPDSDSLHAFDKVFDLFRCSRSAPDASYRKRR